MATSGSSGRLGWSSRCMLWTLNNYSEDDVVRLITYGQTACRYLCFGYEIAPSTGTPHLQGYTAFDNKKSADKFKSEISEKLHLMRANGTAQKNKEYCSKIETKDPSKNPQFLEFGELPRQGERTDWCVALNQIKSGTPVEEVVDAQPQLLPCIRSLEAYKSKQLKPCHRPVSVYVLWGDAGTGKSRWAYDNFPGLYSKPANKWWDGYTGQTTILLDDFYGYIPYSELLRVLDRYPYQAEVKCSHVEAQWTTVIITSNKPPELWYQGYGLSPALQRRITKIFFYSIDAPPTQTWPPQSPQEEGS